FIGLLSSASLSTRCSSLSLSPYSLCTFSMLSCLSFFHDTATSEIYTLSLHDALPIFNSTRPARHKGGQVSAAQVQRVSRRLQQRSEEHTSELQSRENLVCRLLLEKKNSKQHSNSIDTTSTSRTA